MSKADKTDELSQQASSSPSLMVGPTDDMGAREARQLAEAKADKGKKGKRYKVTIHSTAGGDNSDVVIGHNYVLNQYKRNVEVEMAEPYLAVLRDAVVSTTVQSSNGVNTEVTIPQYTYTVHGQV